MRTPLRPIQAGPGKDSPAMAHGVEIDAELGDQLLTLGGQGMVAPVQAAQSPRGEEAVAEIDAKPPSQVVITGPRLGEGNGAAVLT
jgi:hypothetical protein